MMLLIWLLSNDKVFVLLMQLRLDHILRVVKLLVTARVNFDALTALLISGSH